MSYELRSARFLASEIRSKVVFPGAAVIDATLGNGHDTLELAQLVGEKGTVYGFDIQPDAVQNTRQRLTQAGLIDRCTLWTAGHQEMLKYIKTPVDYVSFNLGWLPGGNKHITTLWETTKTAVCSALTLLKPMGVMTVCAYPGHAEGDRERNELSAFFSQLRPQDFNILRQTFLNAGAGAPECFVIQKQESCTFSAI